MHKTVVISGVLVLLSLLQLGCASTKNSPATHDPEHSVLAQYSPKPIVVDGLLDEPIWGEATAYQLNLSEDRLTNGQVPSNEGIVKLAWDDHNLYLALNFQDDDLAAEGNQDQQSHWQMGDLCELFLKPRNSTWYWELYVTPKGHKTSYWFPGAGRLGLDSNTDYTCGLDVAAQCQGTLNNWADTDSGWTAEMAMPISDLMALGDTFGPESDWTILIARYNYSRYLVGPGAELTMYPPLSRTNYHLVTEYAPLILVH